MSTPRLVLAPFALLLLASATCACGYPSYLAARGTPPASEAVVGHVPLPPPTDAELANLPALPLVHLPGDGYERGVRYGRACSALWKRATDTLEDAAVAEVHRYVPFPALARFAVRRYAALVARRFDASGSPVTVPAEVRAYVQGIADGSGVEASRILATLALVMLSDASCSAFVAFGPATEDGRLLQLRNLDWGEGDLPASEGTVLLCHEPPDGQRWLSIGFAGLVGSLGGVNESGISVSEIGAKSRDKTKAGMPMPILLDVVLAGAHTLDEAVAILRAAPGTGGYNYMLGSARERRGVVVEKTAHHTAVFEIGGGNYAANPFFEGLAGFDCRGDTAADPIVRGHQSCSGGPGSPVGHEAYDVRYRRQVALFERFGGRLDLAAAETIAREVAPPGNLHSILYDFEHARVYVRNEAWFADGRRASSDAERARLRAAAQPAAVVDLRLCFRGPFEPPGGTTRAEPEASSDAERVRAPGREDQTPPRLPPPRVVRVPGVGTPHASPSR